MKKKDQKDRSPPGDPDMGHILSHRSQQNAVETL